MVTKKYISIFIIETPKNQSVKFGFVTAAYIYIPNVYVFKHTNRTTFGKSLYSKVLIFEYNAFIEDTSKSYSFP